MKTCKIILLTVFLLLCQSVFAQILNSSITIKINGGRYIVSGVVPSDAVKTEIIESVKTQIGSNTEFSGIKVQTDAKPFQADWQANFDKSISKIKTWKSGVFIFGDNQTQPRPGYPPLPQEIANARFLLSDGQTVSLKDYKNKLVVLFFMELWANPAINQAKELTGFYPQISSRNVEIISISSENSPDEQRDFRKNYEKYGFPFKYGWTDAQTFQNFVKISRLNGFPQAFVILDGKLLGVFLGGGTKVTEKLKETIIKILDENNL